MILKSRERKLFLSLKAHILRVLFLLGQKNLPNYPVALKPAQQEG